MSEPTQPSEPTLFPAESTPARGPAPRPQGVMDQLIELFTEPTQVFEKLHRAPGWIGPLLLFMACGAFATFVWAARMDPEAAVHRQFDVMERAFGVVVPSHVVDQALNQAVTQGQPYLKATLGVVLGIPIGFLILAAVLFFFVKVGGEDETVRFRHAWSVALVHSLVVVPMMLLAGIMCLLRPVGGAPSYASLAPTTMAFWLQPENPWMRGFWFVLDPFYLFSFVTLFLAARHTLKLKKGPRIALMAVSGFFGILFHFFGGMF